jgi:hypothetical protein
VIGGTNAVPGAWPWQVLRSTEHILILYFLNDLKFAVTTEKLTQKISMFVNIRLVVYVSIR